MSPKHFFSYTANGNKLRDALLWSLMLKLYVYGDARIK